MIARRIVVHGRVQGVGFRYATVDAARDVGVSGWVRNRRDGSVEAFAQGEASSVDALIAFCRHGPPAARVTAVDVADDAPDAAQVAFELRGTA